MKSDDALYIKVPRELKTHVNQYVTDKKVKGGVSGLVKRFLKKHTKFQKELA